MKRIEQISEEIERGEMRFINARALIATAIAAEKIVRRGQGDEELWDALDVLREDVEV